MAATKNNSSSGWSTPSPVLQPARYGLRTRGSKPNLRSPSLYPQPEDRLELQLLDDLSLEEAAIPLSLPQDSDVESDEGADLGQDSVHVEGVPRSHITLDARRYATPSFAQAVLDLLAVDLALTGWTDFPPQVQGSHLSVHKVSGAMSNAVFFVSCPQLMPPPPTVLVRIYGPCTGSLISRRNELHVLHTLSNKYGIGPQVLGTFDNGRVEEYFKSRPLHKEEMRQVRISRWIARRMREMHTVPPDQMRPSEPTVDTSRLGSHTDLRPILSTRNSSQYSLHSEASNSSAFSFGSSYSTGSTSTSGSFSSTRSLTASIASPSLTESRAPRKRRSRANSRQDSSLSIRSTSKGKERLGAWDNITRWTREASRILKVVEKLRGIAHMPAKKDDSTPISRALASPSKLLQFKDMFDLPRFEAEVKAYRSWLTLKEKELGKSKRCMAHNDTQYGNLLLRMASDDYFELDAQDVPLEPALNSPHEMIIVVDFEYAAFNARGYDIANHFIEWQGDYLSPDFSYSMSAHLPYPTLDERRTFYRAYNALDQGRDDNDRALPALESEDIRTIHLEEEVKIWQPATHASWAQWGVVQARDDILAKVEGWLAEPDKAAQADETANGATTPTEETAPQLRKTKSGGLVDLATGNQVEFSLAEGSEAEFDYLLYALERVTLFRKELKELGIVVPV